VTYWYDKWVDGRASIYNVETRGGLGHVERRGKEFHVRDGDYFFVAVVGSKDEVGPALAEYYKKHSKWRYDDVDEYLKWTEFGLLQVKQEQAGCWSAFRHCEQPLMRGDELATFLTPQEAQSAADAHCADGETDSKGIGDGLSWYMIEKAMPQ
jgi:hypothetical protein